MNKRTTLYCDTDTKEDLQKFKAMTHQSDMLTLKMFMAYIGQKGSIDHFKDFSYKKMHGGLINVKVDSKTNMVISIK